MGSGYMEELMFLFEVTDVIRAGARLVQQASGIGVPLGIDKPTGTTILLPVGKSISRWMTHPDDAGGGFILHQAVLKHPPSGRCLVRQPLNEAMSERRALVFVDCCVDEELGMTRIDKARRRKTPEYIAGFQGQGHTRDLFLFEPGDALFICWPAAAIGVRSPKRFIISWDGQQLLEEACQRRLPPRVAGQPVTAATAVKESRPQRLLMPQQELSV